MPMPDVLTQRRNLEDAYALGDITRRDLINMLCHTGMNWIDAVICADLIDEANKPILKVSPKNHG